MRDPTSLALATYENTVDYEHPRFSEALVIQASVMRCLDQWREALTTSERGVTIDAKRLPAESPARVQHLLGVGRARIGVPACTAKHSCRLSSHCGYSRGSQHFPP